MELWAADYHQPGNGAARQPQIPGFIFGLILSTGVNLASRAEATFRANDLHDDCFDDLNDRHGSRCLGADGRSQRGRKGSGARGVDCALNRRRRSGARPTGWQLTR